MAVLTGGTKFAKKQHMRHDAASNGTAELKVLPIQDQPVAQICADGTGLTQY